LFVRWDETHSRTLQGGEQNSGERGERFNFEAAGNGANRFPDDYYRNWPVAVSEEEIEADGHLKSLSPQEELAVFLSIRGMCQAEAGRYGDAKSSFESATRLVPNCGYYRRLHRGVAH
jgi:hypothetical protein